METRANHVLIGTFVLAFVVGIFVFVVWLAKVELDREFAYYDIFFEGSVSGLSEASQVRFNGIPVGSVIAMTIDPDNATRVRVTIEVNASTPIKMDSVAVLEMQGITGVSLVQISGGSAGSGRLEAKEGERYPVIASAPSKFEELFQGAPDLINRGIVLVDRAANLLNEDNQAAISGILSNTAMMVERLTTQIDAIERIVAAADTSAADVAEAARNIKSVTADLTDLVEDASQTMAVARGTLAGVDGVVEGDVRKAIADLRSAAQSITGVGDGINAFLDDNRDNLQSFSGEGLNEFSRFITEARLLVASISRITNRIEEDPARFLFGTSGSEYRPK